MKIVFNVTNNMGLSGDDLVNELLRTEILMNTNGKLRYHLDGEHLDKQANEIYKNARPLKNPRVIKKVKSSGAKLFISK